MEVCDREVGMCRVVFGSALLRKWGVVDSSETVFEGENAGWAWRYGSSMIRRGTDKSVDLERSVKEMQSSLGLSTTIFKVVDQAGECR